MRWMFISLLLVVLCISCKKSDKDLIIKLVDEWTDKKILIPSQASFISYGDSLMQKDSVRYKDYTVVTYIDSIGCISCKLQLDKWKEFMHNLNSIAKDNISYLFIFHPKKRDNKELIDLLKRTHFIYPVCIDENDSFNKLNHFPSDIMFQTFLTNKDNRVIAIGNPIHNTKIKELYLNIISGESPTLPAKKNLQTSMTFDKAFKDMGTFNWEQEQLVEFKLTNTGDELLVIDDISTSCGCTTVDYSKEPVQIGKSLILKVKYRADHPEHFSKTITLYCNAKDAPFQLKISGNAK